MKRYLMTLCATCAITIASLIPAKEFPEVDVPLMDKWVHFLMYGTLSACAWWDYKKKTRSFHWGKASMIGFLFPVFWGGLMELVQAYLTTTRSGDWIDFVANAIGATLASSVAYIVCFHWQKGIARK